MAWLTDMVDEGVLQTQTGPSVFSADPRWSDTYITSSYQQGIQRANEELYRQKHESIYESAIPATSVRDAMPMIQSFSLGAFNQPIHADAVGLIYTRTYNELKGVTDDMANKMSQILAQAVAEGRNPKEIYSQLSEQVGISSARARTIARTEMTRAHHVAGINAYRQAGIFNVKVLVEWATSGFSVCPDCADMEGRIFTLDEVFGLIPLHPNCRCVALPADVGETDDERVQGIRESIIGDEYKTKKGELKFRNFYQKKTGNKNPPPRSIRKARRRDRNERK